MLPSKSLSECLLATKCEPDAATGLAAFTSMPYRGIWLIITTCVLRQAAKKDGRCVSFSLIGTTAARRPPNNMGQRRF